MTDSELHYIDLPPIARVLKVDPIDAGEWYERRVPPALRAASISGLESISRREIRPGLSCSTVADFPSSFSGKPGTVTFTRRFAIEASAWDEFLRGCNGDAAEAERQFVQVESAALAQEVDALLVAMETELLAALPTGQQVVNVDAIERTVPVSHEAALAWITANPGRDASLHPLSGRDGYGLLIQDSWGSGIARVTHIAKAGTVTAADGTTVIGTVLRFERRVVADLGDAALRAKFASQHAVKEFRREQQRQFTSDVDSLTSGMANDLQPLPRPAPASPGLDAL